MIRYECDRCGRSLGANDAGRFIVKMEVYAAAGPVELSAVDLEQDTQAEIHKVLDELATANPDTVEDQIYRCLRFDLCRGCQRYLLGNPLGKAGRADG